MCLNATATIVELLRLCDALAISLLTGTIISKRWFEMFASNLLSSFSIHDDAKRMQQLTELGDKNAGCINFPSASTVQVDDQDMRSCCGLLTATPAYLLLPFQFWLESTNRMVACYLSWWSTGQKCHVITKMTVTNHASGVRNNGEQYNPASIILRSDGCYVTSLPWLKYIDKRAAFGRCNKARTRRWYCSRWGVKKST